LDTRTVEPLLERLKERGWLDDHRFALGFARFRAEHRRYGRHRIARELRQKGISDELIEEALAAALPEEEKERQMVRRRVERRLRGHTPPYSDKLLRSAYASLLRAGFPSAIIRDELFARTKSAVPEDVEASEDEGP
jgi:SOS response regulatory protein OraA/RecX